MNSASESVGLLDCMTWLASAAATPPLTRPEVCVSRSRIVMSRVADTRSTGIAAAPPRPPPAPAAGCPPGAGRGTATFRPFNSGMYVATGSFSRILPSSSSAVPVGRPAAAITTTRPIRTQNDTTQARRIERTGRGFTVNYGPSFAKRLKKLESFHLGGSARFAMRMARLPTTSTYRPAAEWSIGWSRSSDGA
jgi:hypothetical protein